jgi:hypothetical protein
VFRKGMAAFRAMRPAPVNNPVNRMFTPFGFHLDKTRHIEAEE